MAETLLKIPEVAARLGAGSTTIYGLIASGELASIKLGRARRIPESAVEALIAQKLAETAVAS